MVIITLPYPMRVLPTDYSSRVDVLIPLNEELSRLTPLTYILMPSFIFLQESHFWTGTVNINL